MNEKNIEFMISQNTQIRQWKYQHQTNYNKSWKNEKFYEKFGIKKW